jgi:orotidine-5'-phosphate decarboxylase
MIKKKIIVALDSSNLKEIIQIVEELKKEAFAFKIGYEFFYNFGIEAYHLIKNKNVKIFLDLKLHDIPNTVKKGVEAISKLDPYFLTIHISGGDEMQISANMVKRNIKILGVSILTSLNSQQAKKFYYNNSIEDIVTDFAKYSLINRLDGIVCSPREIKIVKNIISDRLIIITPGIRPVSYNNPNDDQVRTMTPLEAIEAGANYLVIGRPITKSTNPYEELKAINLSLE